MKKIISIIISAYCIVTVFTACSTSSQDSSDTGDTTATSASSAATTTAATGITESEAATSDAAAVQTLIPTEKLDFYRNGDGTVYQTAYNPMLSYLSANLTKDEDGYHLAMVNGNEYNPEFADCFVTFSDFGEQHTSVIVMEDGTQTESNEINIHGCSECICIERMSLDGMMTYEFTLYPIKNYPDDTSPKENLEEFSATLDNCSFKDSFFEETMPDFLDDEQINLFANATYLMQNVSTGVTFGSWSPENAVKINDWDYYPTGMSYGDFVYYTESIFTPALSAEKVAGCEVFCNIRGELFTLDGARGGNILYSGRSFELISQTDDEIKFKLIAHYSYKDAMTAEQYDAMTEEEREYDEEYTFTMENTLLGWRFSEFNYWL